MSDFVLPRHIQHQCKWCGLWTIGVFKGRRDVPVEEVHDFFASISGHPSTGWNEPAPYRPEGTVYQEGPDDTYSGGGPCEDCHPRYMQENSERRERIARAIRPPREEIIEPEKPEPTEADARSFLMAQGDDDTGGDKGGSI